MSAVAPTGRERRFEPSELLVSKTDPKGRITYANDVFVRVSGYTLPEIIGQPHNLIRHPQMPRGVFRLLWDSIGRGEEIFAFINNLAKNGDHYWVLAHVTPTRDRAGKIIGFHSNRRVPEPAAMTRVLPLYQRMLDEEKRHRKASEAADASARLLADTLTEQHLTYDQYIWSLIDPSTASRAEVA
ncbi:PAS domain S-box-containing protein [Kineosphaera limosa]|uniref:PAS domain-containing protein n=1 Tax=Kineosphaera limosa NBRC 100340 TaxID=1184609 RepID=K6X6X9_9MICO|nr:PAS domain-containing protein [Kineosphaera limosa]NYD99434.1 PAS domain S-box-containing protein [Kineosphaera limosa]GAB94584.1 hypothetical protein KILIM_007_00220 [Kineosphaera limosa NBRC 100340]